MARSALLAAMLAALAESNGDPWRLRSAGTHVVEGSSVSVRTRRALAALGELDGSVLGRHRSRQLRDDDARWADVIVAAESDHVTYVRRWFPDAAARAVTLGQFVREAPLGATLLDQLAVVAPRDPPRAYDVADPAGGDQSVYDACARQLWEMAQVFAAVVGPSGPLSPSG